MMILEEAIRYHEEEAEKLKLHKAVNMLILGDEGYERVVQEHTQTAAWLRELQERRKQPETSCYLGSPCEYQKPDAEIEQLSQEDTISRQVAIDAIDKAQSSLHNAFAVGFIKSKEIITELPPAQPEHKWIPVSERFPKLDEDGYSQKVLACYENYSGCDILEYRATDGIGKWYIGDMDDSPEDLGVIVSAWMPLPEPYKGEQGEK